MSGSPRAIGATAMSTAGVIAVLGAALFASATVAVMIGPVSIAPDVVWKVAFDHVVPGWLTPAWQSFEANIVWDVRLPRVFLAAIAGAGLATTGVALQALLRNPLADPYLLGTSAGASFGAVSVLLLGSSALAGASVSVAAFVGALASTALVYALAWQAGRFPTARLVLSGVAVAYIFSSATNLLIFRVPTGDQARAAVFWLLGSLSNAQWESLGLPTVAVAVSVAALATFARPLNALSLGEESAATLGVDADRVRRIGFLVTSLSTGALVAVTGGIGFVGLMVPHLVRFAIGADLRRLLPAAALAGAVFLIWADVVARTIAAPRELPIGVVTAVAGAPFFLWLMRFGQRRGWSS